MAVAVAAGIVVDTAVAVVAVEALEYLEQALTALQVQMERPLQAEVVDLAVLQEVTV